MGLHRTLLPRDAKLNKHQQILQSIPWQRSLKKLMTGSTVTMKYLNRLVQSGQHRSQLHGQPRATQLLMYMTQSPEVQIAEEKELPADVSINGMSDNSEIHVLNPRTSKLQ